MRAMIDVLERFFLNRLAAVPAIHLSTLWL